MDPNPRTNRILDLVILAIAVVAGTWLRLWLAGKGHNFDVDSWIIAADLMADGKNVYANTWRFPYGPVWFNLLGVLKWLHDSLDLARLGPESFHIVMSAFLTLADLGVMLMLYRWVGLAGAAFYFVNPVMILLTGYHSQIDTLALVSGLAAWMLIRPDGPPASWQRLLASAGLMALSLMTKHILLFFPIWLIFSPRILGTLPRRLTFAAIAYALFIASFLPYTFADGAWDGIRKYVISYGGLSQTSFMLRAVDLIAPISAVDSCFGLVDGVPGMKALMTLLMLVSGWRIMQRTAADPFQCYLLAILIFSPMMADQYLAIPMITCAVQLRRWPVWAYTLLSMWLIQWSAYEHGLFPGPKPWWRNMTGNGLAHQHAVVWLTVLLIMITGKWWRRRGFSYPPGHGPAC